jgi:transposase
MDAIKLFEAALDICSPWSIKACAFSTDERQLTIQMEFSAGSKFACPACQAAGCAVHDTKPQRWRHLDFFQHKAFIDARVPRVRCESCKIVRMVDVPWARKNSGFTLLMESMIMELVKHMPVLPLARFIGVSDGAIWRVLAFHVERAIANMDLSEVDQVGVDETSARRGHEYISMFYDLIQRRLVHVAEGKDASVIADFAKALAARGIRSQQIREVSCDMSPAMIKGIAEHLPAAEITFDKFHVFKLLSDAIDKVRRQEMFKDKTLKGSRYSLLKNPENLTSKQRETLMEVQLRNAKLAEAYRLKETFRDVYRQACKADARGMLQAWVTSAYASGIAAMRTVADTVRKKWQGILRWYDTQITNAIMEGLNSLLQAAKRKARGYRTKRNLRLIAFLVAGRLDFRAIP